MHFVVAPIYNYEPTIEEFNTRYKNRFKAKIAYKVAAKVWLRVRLSEAQNWKCCWCGCQTIEDPKKANSATIEHVIPKARGGTDDWDNLAMSCQRCNTKRAIAGVDEFLKFAISAYVKTEERHEVREASIPAYC